MLQSPNLCQNLKTNDAYQFLRRELEKVDEQILEPLTGTDWPRDMPVITGGGLVDSIASFDVTYASSGQEDDNLFYDSYNDIPVVQADLSKNIARTFFFAEYMAFGIMEDEKMRKIGREPMDFLNKGIRLHCDKVIDHNVYVGFRKMASSGLVNNPAIMRSSARNGAGGQTTWRSKTADEILNDINSALSAVWEANDCASDGLPNHILVPVEQYGMLVTRKVSEDSERSIIAYVKENNIAAQQGKPLEISACKWCSAAGTNYSDRMVVYMNQPDRICFNLTQPLRRLDTETADLRIKIPYFAQFSEVRFLYPSTVRYMDGI